MGFQETAHLVCACEAKSVLSEKQRCGFGVDLAAYLEERCRRRVMCFKESSVPAVGFGAIEVAAADTWEHGIWGDWIVVDDERDGVTGVDEGVVVDHVAQLWGKVEEAERERVERKDRFGWLHAVVMGMVLAEVLGEVTESILASWVGLVWMILGVELACWVL
jgi:hypothetical protein